MMARSIIFCTLADACVGVDRMHARTCYVGWLFLRLILTGCADNAFDRRLWMNCFFFLVCGLVCLSNAKCTQLTLPLSSAETGCQCHVRHAWRKINNPFRAYLEKKNKNKKHFGWFRRRALKRTISNRISIRTDKVWKYYSTISMDSLSFASNEFLSELTSRWLCYRLIFTIAVNNPPLDWVHDACPFFVVRSRFIHQIGNEKNVWQHWANCYEWTK